MRSRRREEFSRVNLKDALGDKPLLVKKKRF